MRNLNKLNSELNKLTFGKVLEINNLTKKKSAIFKLRSLFRPAHQRSAPPPPPRRQLNRETAHFSVRRMSSKQEADNLFELYKKSYIVRGPCKELNGRHNYILSFELNPYKTWEK